MTPWIRIRVSIVKKLLQIDSSQEKLATRSATKAITTSTQGGTATTATTVYILASTKVGTATTSNTVLARRGGEGRTSDRQ